MHGGFHSRRAVNEWAARLAAAWFPTGLSMQRAFHLTHHRHNRSLFEQFDVLHEGDLKWLKHAQWYAILTGVYWLVAVAGVLSYLVVPRVLRARLLRRKSSQVATQTASGIYLAALDEVDPVVGRLEILFSLGVQTTLVVGLDLSWIGWTACYGAFALHWSSLQYADHAFSPLDAHDGAWNLKVSRITRAVFLNYHFHLAHHREQAIPWIHLPSRVDPTGPQPAFWRVLLAMWRGPRRAAAALDEPPPWSRD